MANEIEYEVSERIAQLRINRPKAMNSIHPDLMAELSAAIRRADTYPEVHVLVLSGRGPHFGAGYDLKFNWKAHYPEGGPMGARRMLTDCVEFELTLRDLRFRDREVRRARNPIFDFAARADHALDRRIEEGP